jgi:hypothetical protein
MWLFDHPAISLLSAHAISLSLLHARALSVRRGSPSAGQRLVLLGSSPGRLLALIGGVALFLWPQVRALSQGVAVTGRLGSATIGQSPVAFWAAVFFWFALSSLFGYALLAAIGGRLVALTGER